MDERQDSRPIGHEGAPHPAGAAAVPEAADARPGVRTIAYVEVNDHALASVGRYVYADGSPVYDVAIIFAANIGWNGSEARLLLNPHVVATLEAAETQIRPLQAQGITVSLSLLGDHTGAGISNFPTPDAAAAFAAQLADVVGHYGLDGVDLDDEYADYGKPGMALPNDRSAGWLISALRAQMPDAVLSFYCIGPASVSLSTEDPAVNAQLDMAWNATYGSWDVPDIPGLTAAALSPAAVGVQETSTSVTRSLAEQTVEEGYGVFLTYDLPDDDRSEFVSSFTQPLTGQRAFFR